MVGRGALDCKYCLYPQALVINSQFHSTAACTQQYLPDPCLCFVLALIAPAAFSNPPAKGLSILVLPLLRIQTWHVINTKIKHISRELESCHDPSWPSLHCTPMFGGETKTLLRGAYHWRKRPNKTTAGSQLDLQLHPDQEINDIIISKLKTDQGLSVDLNDTRSPVLLRGSVVLGEFRKRLSWW